MIGELQTLTSNGRSLPRYLTWLRKLQSLKARRIRRQMLRECGFSMLPSVCDSIYWIALAVVPHILGDNPDAPT